MKPIKFKEQNCIYAENQTEYLPLPAFKNPGDEGLVVSCWKLSFTERLRLLLKGKLWLHLMTFNKPLQPIFMTTKKPDILN